MAKTMRNIVLTCILLIVLAGAACALVLTGGCSNMSIPGIGNPFASTKTTAVNTLIDSSGIKDRIESELYAHVGEISARTGIPESMVEEGIQALAVQEWQATEKPTTATEAGTYSAEIDDTPVSVTLYDDSSVVTVEAYGQEVTLAVPESAQQYVDYLPYLQYIQ